MTFTETRKNGLLVLGVIMSAIFLLSISGCSGPPDATLIPEEELSEDKPDRIDEVIAAMSLRQKVAGLIIVGIEGTAANDQTRQMFLEYPFGGVIIYDRNYIRDDWLKDFIKDLHDLSSSAYPFLVCIDEEGGSVSRLPGVNFPSALDMASMSEEEVLLIGGDMAETLIGFGVDLNFAPVLDINRDPRNTVIGNRSFGSDPELVSIYGTALFRGMAAKGIIAAGKHYPGHGSTLIDSHISLPVLDKNWAELLDFELISFRKAIEAGIPAIMTAHIVVSGIDEKPATMSKIMIDLLRSDLGFDGVVISDDLEMGALTESYSWEEIIVETFMAGVDLLLISHSYALQSEAVNIMEDAYYKGIISDDRLNSSLRRVMEMQEEALLLQP